MNWFILTLACIILWGLTDVLYKASFHKNDPLSYHKSFVWVGIVMALAGVIMSTWSDTLLDSVKMVRDDVLYLIPLYHSTKTVRIFDFIIFYKMAAFYAIN